MIKDLEKNDVDVTRLFSWKKSVQITVRDSEEPIKVYMRLVGDAEVNRARVFALRKSAEMRKKLRDEDSDEYFAYIADIDLLDTDTLVSYLLLETTRDLYQKVSKDIEIKKPKELPSDASLEDQEKYQLEIDAFPTKLQDAITEKISKEVDKREKELREKSKEELFSLYRKMIIDMACEGIMYSYFRGMCVYFGTFSDEDMKIRFFSSYDEFDNLPTNTKKEFTISYESMEIGMDELKK